MNPITLFTQIFGKSVPVALIPIFTYYFTRKMITNGGDVVKSLIYAARKTLIPI